jgi:hypothetical protein
MNHMIRVLTKQLQLIEIELESWALAKKYNEHVLQTNAYYSSLLKSYGHLSQSIEALKVSSEEEIHVH